MESQPTSDGDEKPQYDEFGMYLMPRTNLNTPNMQPVDIPSGLGSSTSIAFKRGMTVDPRKNPNDIEGYLSKYSPHLLKGWQKRYVILKDKKLSYKKNKE